MLDKQFALSRNYIISNNSLKVRHVAQTWNSSTHQAKA